MHALNYFFFEQKFTEKNRKKRVYVNIHVFFFSHLFPLRLSFVLADTVREHEGKFANNTSGALVRYAAISVDDILSDPLRRRSHSTFAHTGYDSTSRIYVYDGPHQFIANLNSRQKKAKIKIQKRIVCQRSQWTAVSTTSKLYMRVLEWGTHQHIYRLHILAWHETKLMVVSGANFRSIRDVRNSIF